MWWWNCQMWVKKKTIKCDKSTVMCDVGTAQCDNEIVKYEKKKWFHKMWQKYCQM